MFRNKKTGRLVSKKYAKRYPKLVSRVKLKKSYKVYNSKNYRIEEKFLKSKEKKFTRRGVKRIRKALEELKEADEDLLELLPQNYIRLLTWTFNNTNYFSKSERKKVAKSLHLKDKRNGPRKRKTNKTPALLARRNPKSSRKIRHR